MRPNQRNAALQAALRLMAVDGGGTITIDGVAREAGMTKPGLMYHFPTREALMIAIVDHAAASLETEMVQVLGKPADQATAAERIRAYASVAAQGSASRAEYAIFTEAAYRPDLTAPWTDRMSTWFQLPDLLTPAERARLTAARLAADGLWAAEATGVFAPHSRDRDGVVAVIHHLTLESDDS